MRISDWSSDVCSSDLSPERQRLSGRQLREPAHIGSQSFRDGHAAIRLLIIFQHGHQRASDRQARAIQCMEEARILLPFRPVAGVHAPGLKVAAVGEDAYLPLFSLAWVPAFTLQVISPSKNPIHDAT